MTTNLNVTDEVIVCRDVHLWYGEFEALRGVSLTVKKGDVDVITFAMQSNTLYENPCVVLECKDDYIEIYFKDKSDCNKPARCSCENFTTRCSC